MCVFGPDGSLIDSNDDSNGLLSSVVTQLPVDGKYRVAVSTWPDLGCVGEGGTTTEPFGSGRYVLDMFIYEQPANELIFNGSFEIGFAGWDTGIFDGEPFIPWLIGQAGDGAGFGMQPVAPQDGSKVAWNGFDGTAGTVFQLAQEFSIPASATTATLRFKDRIQWNFDLGPPATIPRTYLVFLLDGNQDFLGFVKVVDTDLTRPSPADLGWQETTLDVSAFAGMDLILGFLEIIPEDATGPGQLEIDDVSVIFE